MARLADRIWEMRWFPPQLLCYAQQYRTPQNGGFNVVNMKRLMEGQRDLIASAPIYAADNVAQWFYFSATRDHDLKVQDFPAIVVPHDMLFVEFHRPALREMIGGLDIVAQLPHSWGWLITKHTMEELSTIFLDKLVSHPAAESGVLCRLWLSHDDASFFAPLCAFGLQVAEDGEIVAAPALSLAFPSDPDRINNVEQLFGYFNALFMPMVMTLSLLACKSTTTQCVEASDKLNKARKRRKKRPFAGYETLDFTQMADILRFQGQAGVAGLAIAMRTCRYHFIQDLHGQSSVILLPGSS